MAADFVPGLGEALGAEDTKLEYDKGNYGMAALTAAATGIGAVPIVGDLAGKGIKKAGDLISQTEEVMKPKMKALHASPHDFDKFKWDDKVRGKGEGAQAFGDGLYVGEAQGTQDYYYDYFGQKLRAPIVNIKGKEYRSKEDIEVAIMNDEIDVPGGVQKHYNGYGYQDFSDETYEQYYLFNRVLSTIFENTEDSISTNVDDVMNQYRHFNKKNIEEVKNFINELGLEKKLPDMNKKPVRYEVEINTSKEKLLDLDRGMSKQTPEVRESVKNTFKNLLKISPEFRQKILGNNDDLMNSRDVNADLDSLFRAELYRKYPDKNINLENKELDTAFLQEEYAKDYEEFIDSEMEPTAEWLVDNFPKFIINKSSLNRSREYLDDSGNALVHLLTQNLDYEPSKVSKLLNYSGIPGSKFLDNFSRNKGEGTRNYVIFDPELIEIVRKYGIATLVSGGLLSKEIGDILQEQGIDKETKNEG
jgi:hypothetical protein